MGKALSAAYQPIGAVMLSEKIHEWVMDKAIAHGLIVRALANDTITLCPPLIIDEHQIDDMFDRVTRALDDAQAHVSTLRAA